MLRKNLTPVIISLLLLFISSNIWGWTDKKVNQDTDNSVQNEPSMTINHHFAGDLLNMVVGYNDIGKSLGISYSPDSGKTWFDSQVPLAYGGGTGDPSLGSDNLGNVYACFLAYKGTVFSSKSGIFVSKSVDGGRNWMTPEPVDDQVFKNGPKVPFTDKCMLAVDTFSSSPYENYIYVAWQRDDTLGYNSDIWFAYSNDLGVSYSTPIKINDDPVQTAFCEGAFPFVGADGDVYVTWYNNYFRGHDDGEMYVDKSTDGGASFGSDVLAANFKAPPLYTHSNTGFKAKTFPSAAADPVNPDLLYITYVSDPDGYFDKRVDWGKHPGVPGQAPSWNPKILQDGNNVYMAWVDNRNSGINDIYFNRSTDNGLTWDFPDKGPINTSSNSSWRQDISSSSNYVYCVWEDFRSGSAEIYFNRSSDYGNTWQSSDVRLHGGLYSAEAPTIASIGNYVYVAWTNLDNPLYEEDIYFTYSSNNGTSWSTPQQIDLNIDDQGNKSIMPRLAFSGNDVYCVWQFQTFSGEEIFFNYSSNNGVTWFATAQKLSAGTNSVLPVIKSIGNNVYVCWNSDKNSPSTDIFFNNSTNNGVNWLGEVQISDGGFHATKPFMINEGSNIYIAWEDDRFTGGSYINDIFINYSLDNGSTWSGSPNIIINNFPGVIANNVNLASDGQNVYATWYDERNWGFGSGDIFFNKSSNNGATWGTENQLNFGSFPIAIQGITKPVISAENNNVTVGWTDQRVHGLPNLYVNHSSDNGASWLDGMDEADIYCVRSTNGGTSWQTPVKVNDDAGDYAQLLPCVVVKANGMVDISYYSYRQTPVNPMFPGAEVRMAVSSNQGVSFMSSFPIQDTVVTPMTDWVGEYNGMAVLDNFVYTVFTDFEQNNNSDIYIDRSSNPTPPTGCCIGVRGNADGDPGDKTDVDDLVYMVDFAFKGGPGVACLEEGDVDASGVIDVDDLVFMVDFAFKGGPAPGACP